ncbi:MAG: hypothetical protein ABIF09_15670 [Gemmatimonadota bacterium]
MSRHVVGGPFPESPVPEALGRLLALLEKRVSADAMDRVWIFPPLVRGRKEWGLVAVSCLTEDPSQRTLVTGRYAAEMTGKGVLFQPEFMSEGSAPPDRLPHVMDGVVRRSDLQLGVPRVTEIGGDAEKYWDLLVEYGWEDRRASASRPGGSLKVDHG